MSNQESSSVVTIKLREYKCKPYLLSGYAAEWVGREIVPTIPDDDEATYEFGKAEFAAGFLKSIATFKIA
jgi:hypothetical protein